MPYIGTSPSNGVRRKHTYTATASQTSFSGAGAEGATLSYNDSNFVDVYQNGVKLSEADYTSTSGTAIVLATGATVSDIVEVVVYDVFSVADTVSKADGGTFDASVTFAGDIIKSTAGTSNFAAGVNAGNSIASGGNYNTVVGDEAGTALTTGDGNVAVGFEALKTEDGHGNNVAVGYQSLKVQNAGANAGNTAIGYQSGVAVTDGHSNTLLGAVAGSALTTGDENTYVGYSAGSSGTATFTGNTALGFNTFAAGTNLGDANTAIGWSVLKNTNANSNGHNTAVGYNAGRGNDSGYDNTFIGSGAGNANSTGYSNTMLGKGSGSLITTGNANTIIGRFDGNQNSLDIRTASNNIVLSDGDGFPRVQIDSTGKMHIPMAPTSRMIHADNSNSRNDKINKTKNNGK